MQICLHEKLLVVALKYIYLSLATYVHRSHLFPLVSNGKSSFHIDFKIEYRYNMFIMHTKTFC